MGVGCWSGSVCGRWGGSVTAGEVGVDEGVGHGDGCGRRRQRHRGVGGAPSRTVITRRSSEIDSDAS